MDTKQRQYERTQYAKARIVAYTVLYGKATEDEVRANGHGDLLDRGRALIRTEEGVS